MGYSLSYIEMIIREIAEKDNKQAASIIRDAFDEYGLPKTNTVYDDPRTDCLFEQFKRESGSRLWVAEEDGIVIGLCGMFPTEGLPSDWCEIVKFYVSKSARGRGIGKRLFAKTCETAKHLGYTTAYLETFPELVGAINMYKRMGFHAIDKQMGNSGHTATSIWMIKNL